MRSEGPRRHRRLRLAAGGAAVFAAGVLATLVLEHGVIAPDRASPDGTGRPTGAATAEATAPGPARTLQPSGSRRGCADDPGSCGYPDASSTGVPDGVRLTEVPKQASSGPGWHFDQRGWIVVDGAGTVLERIATTYPIEVTAPGVTVRESRIVVSGERWGVGLRHTANVTVEACDITSPAATGPDRLLVGIKDVHGDSTGLKVLRNDISHTSTAVQIESGLVRDNYLHDPGITEGDHVNGTTSNGGSRFPLHIVHNTIFNHHPQTDAVSLFQDFGVQHDRLIHDNLLAGGGWTVYAGANPGMAATATRIVVTDNRFSRRFFPNGGHFGPLTAFSRSGGNVWSGNVWDDTGKPVD